MLEIIECLKLAKIGEYKKWESIIKKINNGIDLDPYDSEYFITLSRTYKEGIGNRTKIYHIKLSEQDSKPKCQMCQEESLFYCNMNDAYFCPIHVLGHDENEL